MNMKKIVVMCILVMLMPVINAEIDDPGTPGDGGNGNQNPDLEISEEVVNDALYDLTRGLPYKGYGRCFGEDGEKYAVKDVISSRLPNSEKQPINTSIIKWKDDESYKLIIKIVNLTTNETEQTIDVPCFPLIAKNIISVHINVTGGIYTTDSEGNNSEYTILLYELNPSFPYDYWWKSRNWKRSGYDAFILYDIHNDTFFMGPPTRAKLPGLSIPGYYGNLIKNYIQNQNYRVDAYFKQVNEIKNVGGKNVIGTIYGKDHSKYILVSAHHDSWWGECAVDDASGVAEVIGIANAFEGAPQPKYDIKFVTFTGEEYSQIGSKEFNDRDKIYVQINVDMIFAKQGTFVANYYHHRFPEAFQYAGNKTKMSIVIKHGGYWKLEPLDLVTPKAISFGYERYPYYHRTTADRSGGDSYDEIDTSDISTEGQYILKIVEWFAYNHNPYVPRNPCPANNSTNIPFFFSWEGGDPDFEDEVKYDVYFGTNPHEMQLAVENLSHPWVFHDKIFRHLSLNTTYYWKVVAKDNFGGVTEGPLWCFKVENEFSMQNLTICYAPNVASAMCELDMNAWSYDFSDGTYCIFVNGSKSSITTSDISFYYFEQNHTQENYIPSDTFDEMFVELDEMGVIENGPLASFDISPISPNVGEEVNFIDTSQGNIVSWHWDFGDGNMSGMQNPTHTYQSAGYYTVSLTITDSDGKTSGFTRFIHVSDYLGNNSGNSGNGSGTPGGYENMTIAQFSYSPSDPSIGEQVNFYDESQGNIVSWQWSFGDNSYSNLQNPSHSYSATGFYNVKLTVTDDEGISSSAIQLIIVDSGDTGGQSGSSGGGNNNS